ncbi:histidine kinase, partial [Streptomyces tricolor]
MRTRLLPLLIVLLAAVLLALGIPLAVSLAAAQQQQVVVDRIDDTARFAALAQFVTDAPGGSRRTSTDERRESLRSELESYYGVYGIRAGVFYRNGSAMANAPDHWLVPQTGEVRSAFAEALLSRRSHDPRQVWP